MQISRALIGTAALAIVGSALMAMGPEHKEHRKAKPVAKAVIGEEAPGFQLVDTEGKTHTLAEYTEAGKVVVLEWFNPGCPFVQGHYTRGANTMNDLAERFADDGVVWLRVNSGGEGSPSTGVETNDKARDKWTMEGPVLLDYSGKVGKAYAAKTTPAMYVIDADGVLAYAGAIDGKRLKKPDTNFVELAIKSVLAGETVETAQTKSYGCAVKYAKGGG